MLRGPLQSPGWAVPGCRPKGTPGLGFHLAGRDVHEGDTLLRHLLCPTGPRQPPPAPGRWAKQPRCWALCPKVPERGEDSEW